MGTLLPCPFCGGRADFERVGTPRMSTIVTCQECGCKLEGGEAYGHGRQWNERASVWQPIDSAPKDGTRIILSGGGRAVTGYYLDNSKAALPWQGWKVPSMEKQPSGRPDRWMPFPAT